MASSPAETQPFQPEDLPSFFGNLGRSTSHRAESRQSTTDLHTFSSATSSTATLSDILRLGPTTDFNTRVTEHSKYQENSKNCTGETSGNPSVVISAKDVANSLVIQLKNAHLEDQKGASSINFTNLFGQIGRFLSFLPQQNDEELSPMCEAAGNSTLLKSLFCPNQLSSAEKKNFPNLMKHAKHLAPAIIANLTEAMNLIEAESDEDISAEAHSNETDSLFTLSSIPAASKTSPIWIHSSKFFNYENGSTTLVANFSFSPFATLPNTTSAPETDVNMGNSIPINMRNFMANLTDLLRGKHLDHAVPAVHFLNHTIPGDLLDSLLSNDSGLEELFNKSKGEENAESIMKEVTPVTTSTTDDPTETNVLHKNFWKSDRRHPIKGLQRIAGPRLQKIPSIGRRWRTMSPASSLFRPFPKLDDTNNIVEPISTQ